MEFTPRSHTTGPGRSCSTSLALTPLLRKYCRGPAFSNRLQMGKFPLTLASSHSCHNCPRFLSRPQLPFLLPSPHNCPFPFLSPAQLLLPSLQLSLLSLLPRLSLPPPHYCPFSPKRPTSPLLPSAPDTHLTTPTLSLLPRPTGGALQLSCPARPSRIRACTRRHGNLGPGGHQRPGLLGAGAVKTISLTPLGPRLTAGSRGKRARGQGKAT